MDMVAIREVRDESPTKPKTIQKNVRSLHTISGQPTLFDEANRDD